MLDGCVVGWIIPKHSFLLTHLCPAFKDPPPEFLLEESSRSLRPRPLVELIVLGGPHLLPPLSFIPFPPLRPFLLPSLIPPPVPPLLLLLTLALAALSIQCQCLLLTPCTCASPSWYLLCTGGTIASLRRIRNNTSHRRLEKLGMCCVLIRLNC